MGELQSVVVSLLFGAACGTLAGAAVLLLCSLIRFCRQRRHLVSFHGSKKQQQQGHVVELDHHHHHHPHPHPHPPKMANGGYEKLPLQDEDEAAAAAADRV
jgi:ABC-type nickel/cobalt efflux system permease component RcnA